MNQYTPDNIKDLMAKALKHEISEEENKLLELWYDQAIPNELDWAGPEQDEGQLKDKLFAQIKAQIAIELPIIKLPFYKSIWFKVAASIVLIAGIASYFMMNKDGIQDQFVYVQKDGIKKIILPDSSIVWLKGKSTLSYPEQFQDSVRIVDLEGEALFEVTKDKDHPFVVKTRNYTTRVLGTSFNLNTRNRSYNLIVLTGKVQVNEIDAKSNTQKVLAVVTPNQGFERVEQRKGAVTAPKETEKIIITKGTEYPMNFAHTPFAIIIDRIERKFDIQFAKVDYTTYNACTITADLTDQSLKNSLDMLASAMGAEYKIENNIITIGGGGCK